MLKKILLLNYLVIAVYQFAVAGDVGSPRYPKIVGVFDIRSRAQEQAYLNAFKQDVECLYGGDAAAVPIASRIDLTGDFKEQHDKWQAVFEANLIQARSVRIAKTEKK